MGLSSGARFRFSQMCESIPSNIDIYDPDKVTHLSIDLKDPVFVAIATIT